MTVSQVQDDHARLFAAFDALCDATPVDRAARLTALRRTDPALADELSALLSADAATRDSAAWAEGVALLIEPHNPLVARLQAASPEAPVEVGGLRVTGSLGAGGMGCVFAATDAAGTPVALKTLHRLSPAALRRFKHEFRLVAAVAHPNLVTPHALVELEDTWFIRLPFVAGEDFAAHIEAAPPGPARRARLEAALPQLAAALGALHGAGVLHLDIKPSNVLVQPDGVVRVLDFGIAHAMDATATGDTTGTPLFMAPEQFGAGPLGPAADTYALGVLLHWALTGRPPVRGEPATLAARKAALDPATLPIDAPWASPAVVDLCRACLAPAPADRPADAALAARVGAATSGAPAVAPFVGRGDALAALDAAWAEARGGRALAVCVEGPSGIGKSRLLDRFVGACDALILATRCHPHESIRFRAIDGAIDGLAHHLARWPIGEAPPECPPVGPLLDAFPTLAEVLRQDGDDGADVADELAAVVSAVCARRPILWIVDDAQWGDADSARLLSHLLTTRPRAPLLLLLARRDDGSPGALLDGLQGAIEPRRLALAPLTADEAMAVARAVGADDAAAARAAAEAGGLPFVVEELARSAGGQDLAGRLADLPPATRRALDVLAVAGEPLGLRTALALGGSAVDPYDALTVLQGAR